MDEKKKQNTQIHKNLWNKDFCLLLEGLAARKSFNLTASILPKENKIGPKYPNSIIIFGKFAQWLPRRIQTINEPLDVDYLISILRKELVTTTYSLFCL